jgi:phosphomevalonate kinase
VTRARAPGKVVLSGAYAVLSGAPAIVSAVARYVTADSARPAELVTEELRAALAANERAPWFDASPLRNGGRKLGLGSSAAILVASLFALEREAQPNAQAAELRQRVFERALSAHRLAQGGGSGVDVAASSFGGTLGYRLTEAGPQLLPLRLPASLVLEIWVCPSSASTAQLLASVRELGRGAPELHARLLGAQEAASEQALASVQRGDAQAFVAALSAQQRALSELGRAAGVAIVTPELTELVPLAEAEAGALLPAGAGGGDLALFAAGSPSSAALRAGLEARGHWQLLTALAAEGVAAA